MQAVRVGIILFRMLRLAAIGIILAAPQAPWASGTAELEAALKRNPGDAAAWKALGIAYASERKSEAALTAFSEACKLDPKDEDGCYYLGRQLFSLGRYAEAVKPFEAAATAAPKEKLARTHRAAALNFVALGSSQEAERHFREAVRASRGPEQVRADVYTDYGAFLFREARPSEALEALEQAVKIDSRSARGYMQLGRVLLHLGKAQEAASALERAAELDTRSAGIRLLLGRAYLALGRKEDAERQLQLGREAWDRDSGSSIVK